jgi:isopenicillin-N N-acyltransferase-like protein
MHEFELIELEGEDYERGRQYGARVAVAIQQNLEDYLRLIESYSGMGRAEALEAAAAFGPVLEEHAPNLLREMRGIADGAACALVDVLLLNARSELMGTMCDGTAASESAGECTALAAGPEITTTEGVLLGQNWDWYTAIEAKAVLLHIRQPDKPDILTLTEAGQVGTIGMNSAGLGVCLNFLSHIDQGLGVPTRVLLRQMLGCAHLGAGIREAYRVPRGGAVNVLLAHAEGECLDLELTPSDADFLYADAGWLVHANHYESARLRGGDTGLATSMSTLARAARARRLLAAAAARGEVSMETYQSILRDHAYGAYAICRHADPSEPPLQQTATLASVIMDLSARTMFVAAGQPCREEYRVYTLAG